MRGGGQRLAGAGHPAAPAAVAAADHVVGEHLPRPRPRPGLRPRTEDGVHGAGRLHVGEVDLAAEHLAVTVLGQPPQHHALARVLKENTAFNINCHLLVQVGTLVLKDPN